MCLNNKHLCRAVKRKNKYLKTEFIFCNMLNNKHLCEAVKRKKQTF